MPNLKEVKNRIQSVISTQQITKAMKMVAAAKLKKAQDRIIQMRPYAHKLHEILQNVSGGDRENSSVFAKERQVKRAMVVVITSDRGLCGAFNGNVVKAANRLLKSDEFAQLTDTEIMPIGKKALDAFAKSEWTVRTDYAELFAKLNFDQAKVAAEYVMNQFEEGYLDKVYLVYNEFKNIATQIIRTEQFLPIEVEQQEEVSVDLNYIYEPSKDFVVEELIPKSLKLQFYKALAESNAAEHGARMTAMDKATENAGELLKELRLSYNRTRQAAITTEILEIVAGAEALAAK